MYLKNIEERKKNEKLESHFVKAKYYKLLKLK